MGLFYSRSQERNDEQRNKIYDREIDAKIDYNKSYKDYTEGILKVENSKLETQDRVDISKAEYLELVEIKKRYEKNKYLFEEFQHKIIMAIARCNVNFVRELNMLELTEDVMRMFEVNACNKTNLNNIYRMTIELGIKSQTTITLPVKEL